MGFIQKTLNKDQPYGRVFAGSGEQHEDDRQCAFYQHGLYFDAQGNLLEDHPHNAEMIKKLSVLSATPRQAEEAPVTGNPEVIQQLNGMSDEEVYEAAKRLVAFMLEDGKATDFEPTETNRDASIDFILVNTA